MKNPIKATAICLLLLSLTASLVPAAEKIMSLQVRKGALRSTPTFLGKTVTNVDYGERVSVLEQRGDWSKVSPLKGGEPGWIHTSALTKKKIKIEAGEQQANLAASSGELALAGKGFNSDVEADFKSKNRNIDFSMIDKMEKIKVTAAQMTAFLEEGQVSPSRGGAK